MSQGIKRKVKLASVPGSLAQAWNTKRTQKYNVKGTEDIYNTNAGRKSLKKAHPNSTDSIEKGIKFHDTAGKSKNYSDSSNPGSPTKCQSTSAVHKLWCDACKANDNGGSKGNDNKESVDQRTPRQKKVKAPANPQKPTTKSAKSRKPLLCKNKKTLVDTEFNEEALNDGKKALDDAEEAADDEKDILQEEEDAVDEEEEVVDDNIKKSTVKTITKKAIDRRAHQLETLSKGMERSKDSKKPFVPFDDFPEIKEYGNSSRVKLRKEYEQRLSEWCQELTKIGCLVLRSDIPKALKYLLDTMGVTEFRNDNQPSNHWVVRYLQRYPEVFNIIQSSYPKVVCNKDICSFFSHLSDYLAQKHGLNPLDFLSQRNASRVFSCDGTAFFLESKMNYQRISLIPRENIGIKKSSELLLSGLFCMSASGDGIKPLIISKDKDPLTFGKSYDVKMDSFMLTASENGFMTGDIFFFWLSCVFHKYLDDNNVTRPVVLFSNGIARNISVRALAFAQGHGIIIFCFPLHASYLLQPLHKPIFRDLRDQCDKLVELKEKPEDFARREWIKKNFSYILLQAYEKAKVNENVVAGFRNAGLLPFNPLQLKKRACERNHNNEYPQHRMEANLNHEDHPNKMAKIQESVKTGSTQAPSIEEIEELKFYETGSTHIPSNEKIEEQKYCVSEDDLRAIYAAAYSSCQEDLQRRVEVLIPRTKLKHFRTKGRKDYRNTLFKIWREISKRPVCPIKQNVLHQSSSTVKKNSRKTLPDIDNLSQEFLEKMTHSLQHAVVKLHKLKTKGKTELVASELYHDNIVKERSEEIIEDKDDLEVKMKEMYSAPHCPVCSEEEKEGEGKKWIGCETCPAWYHKACAGISLALSNKEIRKLHFSCKNCAS